MIRKLSLLLVLLVVFGMLFVGCQGESDQSEGGEAAPAEGGDTVTLTIESWRNDDLPIWEDVIIPAFNEQYPDIEVIFQPLPPAEYNQALNAKLEGDIAGDLITARPFDASLSLYEQGYLADLSDLPGMDNFSDVAKSAWQTDDGSATFAVPMASVIHGFIYNAEIFDELGLEEPETVEEFFECLEAIEQDGTYVPLAIGTSDLWEAATMGFQNIGPNYWNGEEGRRALIAGEEKLTDDHYAAVWEQLAQWADYMGPGYETRSYSDSQNLFTHGRSAIFPAGSWEISLFNQQADFEMGAFPPPLPAGQDTLYISDHTDIAMGMNPDTEYPEEARLFLEWMTTQEFAELYSNELPGFFSLSDHAISLDDPLAQEVMDWRQIAESTIRNSYQILSRGEPNLENQLWNLSAQVMNGDITPKEAAQSAQNGLEQWYGPQQ